MSGLSPEHKPAAPMHGARGWFSPAREGGSSASTVRRRQPAQASGTSAADDRALLGWGGGSNADQAAAGHCADSPRHGLRHRPVWLWSPLALGP